jgi:hypothetical protein
VTGELYVWGAGSGGQLGRPKVAEHPFGAVTTAVVGDVAPVGGYAYAVSAIEALCGILFPCTLIARITSIPEAEAACRVEEQMAAEAETLSGQASRSTPARSSPRASC